MLKLFEPHSHIHLPPLCTLNCAPVFFNHTRDVLLSVRTVFFHSFCQGRFVREVMVLEGSPNSLIEFRTFDWTFQFLLAPDL